MDSFWKVHGYGLSDNTKNNSHLLRICRIENLCEILDF